ncbi:MAG: hypothetical protein JWN54_4004 [Mycobacterium sp.]|jgi:predicted DNA-binding transcriptional regulator YafY|nr:hypothetical protein [Mycobacterium sp.]
MLNTSARLLQLLVMLQSRPEWTAVELADRLGVAPRTIRRDVDRLRELGYPVNGLRGTTGGYRLGAGSALPPLLLNDEEAVATALGLQMSTMNSVAGIGDAALRALTKLRQVLPSRLHHRVDSLQHATEHAYHVRTTVDVSVLVAIADACSRHERMRFDYRTHDGTELRREVEPHRLVSLDGRWYLVAWDPERDGWRTFRADRLRPKTPNGPRFSERELPAGGAADMVAKGVAGVLTPVWARVRMHAPAEQIAPMVRKYTGSVEPESAETCIVTCGGDSARTIAWWLGSFNVDFTVLEPAELEAECQLLGRRFLGLGTPEQASLDVEGGLAAW